MLNLGVSCIGFIQYNDLGVDGVELGTVCELSIVCQ